MARTDYTIPVKVRLEQGRYRHGYVKKLPEDGNGEVAIMYAGGRLSSRSARSLIYVPGGFNPLIK